MANDSVAAIEAAEQWADQHHELLQKILDDPAHDHGARALLPAGGLCVAHVVGLVGELSTRRGGPWEKRYARRLKGGQAVALHTWLYHLGGCFRGAIPHLLGGSAAHMSRSIPLTSRVRWCRHHS